MGVRGGGHQHDADRRAGLVPAPGRGGGAARRARLRHRARRHRLTPLEAYCAAGSLRRTADLLHLHHSSVVRRLEQLGRALDFELTEPDGLLRARLALTAWRLLDD
ncbi:helix-turn-helix domain-containing protein [Streptomyces sp. NPDC059009]|uniref:helix-turn-helix domain-containing protein n=1 Tax=Streptomyces sp. NPDC059009 TaxID=3346694 RepID=UPI003680F0F3